jgi:hypothetical protein
VKKIHKAGFQPLYALLGFLTQAAGLGWDNAAPLALESPAQVDLRNAGPSTAPLAMKLREASLRMTVLWVDEDFGKQVLRCAQNDNSCWDNNPLDG